MKLEVRRETRLAVNSPFMSSELLNRFTAFLDVAPLTVKAYKSGLKLFGKYLYSAGVKNPTRETIVAYKKELQDAGRKPSTISLYLSALRRFFAWTESEGIYANITAGVKAPKLSKGYKKDCFTAEQVKSIFAGIDRSSVEGLRNYAIMALMTAGGLRTVEITRAKIEDLRTVGGETVLYIQGKGRTEKTDFVKLPPQVETAIRAYLNARGQAAENSPLFASQSRQNRGKGLTTRTISGIAKTAMLNAGFNSKRLTAHSLRHTAVTLALLAGQDLAEVQHFARHNNISTTQIYAHNIDRMKSQCEAVIASAIF